MSTIALHRKTMTQSRLDVARMLIATCNAMQELQNRLALLSDWPSAVCHGSLTITQGTMRACAVKLGLRADEAFAIAETGKLEQAKPEFPLLRGFFSPPPQSEDDGS